MEANPAHVIGEQSASADLVSSDKKQPLSQRLVVCLDGTWNKRDSGTNVYHLSNLIQEGEVTDKKDKRKRWLQRIYYDEGVGTGLLDGITGGALGIGLSENVREAYDWLVEHYHEGDELYIFGFSRGAFTGRSLVGLIAKCGLLRRGAPVSPAELWSAYQILGRHCHKASGSEPAENWWEQIAGKQKKPFCEIHELQPDWWVNNDPGPFSAPVNRAERLLVEWSRRVPIHCIGVFDTVGSMGLDALAIPWLRDYTAQFHDTRLNTLVLYGFHALALDEHRANFSHIPWHREIPPSVPADHPSLSGRVEQRWFVGAHSNIGGGYEDDLLSQYPLRWFIEETRQLGLVFREPGLTAPDPAVLLPHERCIPLLAPEKGVKQRADKPPNLRDSFDDFAGGFWRHFIRSKRDYRRLSPPAELQNGTPVQSINETLDSSVCKLLTADQARVRVNGTGGAVYNPPNLWAYLKATDPHFKIDPPKHRYSDPHWKWFVGLIVWLGLIAFAGFQIGAFLNHRVHASGGFWNWRLLGLVLPLIALFADWRESLLNHLNALYPDGGTPRRIGNSNGRDLMKAEYRAAWLDFYLAIRLWAIAAAALGAVILVVKLVWPWLRLDIPPSTPLRWLVALDLLWIHFLAAMEWCAAPMDEAGLGSIVKLQFTRKPSDVVRCLSEWAGKRPGPESKQMLMPVVRTLWRDLLGFIPIYTVFLFIGTWVAFSLAQILFARVAPGLLLGLLSPSMVYWLPALALALVCALADLMEDRIHLRYVREFPAAPPTRAVTFARVATWVKIILFLIALTLTALGTVGLALIQFWAMIRSVIPGVINNTSSTFDILWGKPLLTAGTISLIAASAAGLLIYGTWKKFHSADETT